jgi:hypothetical protein
MTILPNLDIPYLINKFFIEYPHYSPYPQTDSDSDYEPDSDYDTDEDMDLH